MYINADAGCLTSVVAVDQLSLKTCAFLEEWNMSRLALNKEACNRQLLVKRQLVKMKF